MDADWDNIPKSCLMGLSRKADAEAAIKMSFMISAVLSYLGYMWTGGGQTKSPWRGGCPIPYGDITKNAKSHSFFVASCSCLKAAK